MAERTPPIEIGIVEMVLDRIAAGEGDRVEELLAVLADAPLYTPVSNVEDLADPRGTNRVSVATFSQGSRKLVPTFSNKDMFVQWSAGRYQCFSVAGADLALSLPPETNLILNPGHPSFLELTSEQLKKLQCIESASSSADSKSELQLQRSRAATARLAAIDSNGNLGSANLRDANDTSAVPLDEDAAIESTVLELEAFRMERHEDWQPPVLADRSKLVAELRNLLADFIEVEEAYYQDLGDDATTPVVLGMLCSGLDAERRFILFDRVAELSKKFYGIAGAIEVFDDLDVRSSNSWDLFKSLTPVYSSDPAFRADVFDGEDRGKGLDNSLEKSKNKKSESSWQSVRKTGSKVLHALRGDGER